MMARSGLLAAIEFREKARVAALAAVAWRNLRRFMGRRIIARARMCPARSVGRRVFDPSGRAKLGGCANLRERSSALLVVSQNSHCRACGKTAEVRSAWTGTRPHTAVASAGTLL